MKSDLAATMELVQRDFELEASSESAMTEEALLQTIANRVADMIEHEIDLLFSTMYRLDISEAKINVALENAAIEPANIALAKLILDRQKQRVQSKRYYEVKPIQDIDEELKW